MRSNAAVKKRLKKKKNAGSIEVDFRCFGLNAFYKTVDMKYSNQLNDKTTKYQFEFEMSSPSTGLNCVLNYNTAVGNRYLNQEKIQSKQLISEKWIYIFREDVKKDTIRLYGEFYIPELNKGAQSYREVDWKLEENKQKYSTLDKRPVNELENTTYHIDTTFNNYILLSSIQLPAERIYYYAKNKDILKSRALFVPASPAIPEDHEGKVSLVLFDFQSIAEEYAFFLDQTAEKEEQSLLKVSPSAASEAQRPEYIKKQMMEIAVQLAEKINFVDNKIQTSKIKEHLKRTGRNHALNQCTFDLMSKEFTKLIESDGYKSMLLDHTTNGEHLENIQVHCAKYVETLAASPPASEYLAKQIETEGTLFYRLVHTDFLFKLRVVRFVCEIMDLHLTLLQIKIGNMAKNSGLFLNEINKQSGLGKEKISKMKELQVQLSKLESKSTASIGSTRKARDFYIKKMRIKKQLVIPFVENMLNTYFPDQDFNKRIDFLTSHSEKITYDPSLNKMCSHNTARLNKIVLFDNEIRRLNKEIRLNRTKTQELIEIRNQLQEEMLLQQNRVATIENGPYSRGFKKIVIFCEALNVYFSWAEFSRCVFDNDNQNSMNTGAAFAAGIGSCFDLAGNLNIIADKLFPQTVRKAGTEMGRRIAFTKISVVSSICDIIVSGINIYRYSSNKMYGETIGEMIILSGHIVSLTGSTAALLFVKTKTIFLGITSIAGIIAVILIVIGTFIKNYFVTKPLRDWSDNSPFSKKIEGDIMGRFEVLPLSELMKHYSTLLDCLSECRCEPWFATIGKDVFGQSGTISYRRISSLRFRIFPGMFLAGYSRFFIKLHCYMEKWGDPVLLDTDFFVVDEQNARFYRNKTGILEFIELSWTLKELKEIAIERGYSNETLDRFIERGQQEMKTIFCEAKLHWELRLDYMGQNNIKNCSIEAEDKSLLFPLKSPQKEKDVPLLYFDNFPKTLDELNRIKRVRTWDRVAARVSS